MSVLMRAGRSVARPVRQFLGSAHSPLALQGGIAEEIARLRAEITSTMPDNPVLSGAKSYAQTDEDGILAEIFRRVGAGNKLFAEFGCGNGLENNTHLLLLAGWRGAWFDGDAERVAHIAESVPLRSHRLQVVEAFVTRENAADLLAGALRRLDLEHTELDLLSVDLDGNDIHIMNAVLERFGARVLCVEYNGKFPYDLDIELEYRADHTWAEDDYQGASLAAYVRELKGRYTLISCNISGVNAFFVRDDLVARFTVYPVDELFQPARYHLIFAMSGHPASLKFLAQTLRAEGS